MPKIYRDEDSSDSKGLELADGTKVGKKTTGGAGGSGGSKPHKEPAASGGTSTGGGDGASTSGGGGVGGSGAMTQAGAGSGVEAMRAMMVMTLTNAGRQGVKADHQDRPWPIKNHVKRAQLISRSIESCQSFTSLARRREPCWAIACWTGLQCS